MTGLASRTRGVEGRQGLPSPAGWTRKIATYFSDSSAYWDDVYSSNTVRAQVYRNRMAVASRWATMAGPGVTAADIGTGAGHFAVFLAERGAAVTAIDASEAMLARVTENASRAGVANLVVPMVSDAQRLELASATCHLVAAIGLLSWIEQPALALAEMVRIMKPGGHVIVTMDNASSLARWLDPGSHVSVRRVIYALRRLVAASPAEELPVQLPAPMTWGTFNSLLQTAGLEPLKFEGVGFGPFTFLGRVIVPNIIGLRVDRLLQRLADDKLPWLKRLAIFHIALAVKPYSHDAESV
jgi:ubiquinone/menaquinone biosynthesis C-methylase UbiE